MTTRAATKSKHRPPELGPAPEEIPNDRYEIRKVAHKVFDVYDDQENPIAEGLSRSVAMATVEQLKQKDAMAASEEAPMTDAPAEAPPKAETKPKPQPKQSTDPATDPPTDKAATATKPKPKQNDEAALAKERAELEERIAGIRDNPQARELINAASEAVAAIDNEAAGLQRRIDEIDATIGARTHKRRQEEAARAAQQHHEQRRQLAHLRTRRQEAIGRVEAATRELRDGLTEVLELNRRLGAGMHKLGGTRFQTGATSEPDFVRRLSEKITVTMRTIPQYHARFGTIEWFSGGFFRPDQDWVEDEERRLAPTINPIIEKDENNG